jgi:hypothetical protein
VTNILVVNRKKMGWGSLHLASIWIVLSKVVFLTDLFTFKKCYLCILSIAKYITKSWSPVSPCSRGIKSLQAQQWQSSSGLTAVESVMALEEIVALPALLLGLQLMILVLLKSDFSVARCSGRLPTVCSSEEPGSSDPPFPHCPAQSLIYYQGQSALAKSPSRCSIWRVLLLPLPCTHGPNPCLRLAENMWTIWIH